VLSQSFREALKTPVRTLSFIWLAFVGAIPVYMHLAYRISSDFPEDATSRMPILLPALAAVSLPGMRVFRPRPEEIRDRVARSARRDEA
jgi:hypothetical protein